MHGRGSVVSAAVLGSNWLSSRWRGISQKRWDVTCQEAMSLQELVEYSKEKASRQVLRLSDQTGAYDAKSYLLAYTSRLTGRIYPRMLGRNREV